LRIFFSSGDRSSFSPLCFVLRSPGLLCSICLFSIRNGFDSPRGLHLPVAASCWGRVFFFFLLFLIRCPPFARTSSFFFCRCFLALACCGLFSAFFLKAFTPRESDLLSIFQLGLIAIFFSWGFLPPWFFLFNAFFSMIILFTPLLSSPFFFFRWAFSLPSLEPVATLVSGFWYFPFFFDFLDFLFFAGSPNAADFCSLQVHAFWLPPQCYCPSAI